MSLVTSAAADTTSQAHRIAQRQSWKMPVGAKKLSGVGLRWLNARPSAAMTLVPRYT